jgi:hypothetical protein
VGYLSGEDEARLTYFAAHRRYGWAAGPVLLLDIIRSIGAGVTSIDGHRLVQPGA